MTDKCVIAITPDGETIISNIDNINTGHTSCLIDIEHKLNLSSIYATDQMEHAWYLAGKGIISLQLAKDIVYIITAPKVDMITSVQLQKLYEIIKNNFNDVEIFGVDLVSSGNHETVIMGDKFEFGINELNEIFNFETLKNHRTK